MKENPLLKQLSKIATRVASVQKEKNRKEKEALLNKLKQELDEKHIKEVSLIIKNLPQKLKDSAEKGEFSCSIFNTTGYCKDGIFYGLHGDYSEHNKPRPEGLCNYPTLQDKNLLTDRIKKEEKEFVRCHELSESLERALEKAGYPFKKEDVKKNMGDDHHDDIRTIGYKIIIEWPENS